MTLPEGVEPSGPTPAPEPEAAAVVEEAAVTEPVTTDPAVTADEETPEEAASDAALRAWAKDNGIEGVPTSGRLSAAWRDQITTAMAAALDPKDAGTAEATPSESSTSVETMTETTTPEPSGGESPTARTEKPEFGPGSDQPEFAHGGGEYRSVFYAPNTFVHSQAYTS